MQREVWAFVIYTFFFPDSFSQERSVVNQAYLDPFVINPAAAGSENFPIVRMSYEKKWIGFRESPSTFLLSGNVKIGKYDFYNPKGLVNKGPLRISDRVALGGAFYYDRNGPLSGIGGILSYAYHVPLRTSHLSMGISTHLLNKSLNLSELKPGQPDDEYLLNDDNQMFRANFGVGLYYYTEQFFSGFSVNELFPLTSRSSLSQANMPSWFILSGYKFEKVTRTIGFEPSFIVGKVADEDLYVDLFARFYYQKFHWAALSYSTAGRVDLMLVLKLAGSFYMGYNYIYTLGRIASYNYGSHRISLGINLGLRGIGKWEYFN